MNNIRTKTCFCEIDYKRTFPQIALELKENVFIICFPVYNKVERTQEISRTSINAIGSEYPTNIVCEHDFLGFAALK